MRAVQNRLLRAAATPKPADIFVFFFQAEDGIRDLTVTGVQTCALPICDRDARGRRLGRLLGHASAGDGSHIAAPDPEGRGLASAIRIALAEAEVGPEDRSEERRVGKEGRSRWSPYH